MLRVPAVNFEAKVRYVIFCDGVSTGTYGVLLLTVTGCWFLSGIEILNEWRKYLSV
jgi:hypothetical protein